MSKTFGRKLMLATAASAALLVGACATETTYRPATGQGFSRTGYTDRQVEQNRFMVSFAGNSSTPRDTVERYLLFRAAEITLQDGGDYFVMVNRDTDLQSRTYTTPGSARVGAMAASAAIGVRRGAITAVAARSAAMAASAGARGMAAASARSTISISRRCSATRRRPRS